MSFFLSKIIWLILNPFNIFIFFTILTIITYFFSLKKISISIFLLNTLFLCIISFFPIGKYLTYQIEKEYHYNNKIPKKIDGILILGGATNPSISKEFNQINVNGSAERLIESVNLIKKYKKVKVIFSGGSGTINRPDLDHSQIAKLFYKQSGLDTNKIIFENKSRNTFENIIFSMKIINPKKDENWILITSASHMKRAYLIGKKYNWDFIPYAVDFQVSKKFRFVPNLHLLSNLNSFQKASHEWIGLISYYLMNRTDKIF